jgi:hypothetical protein
MKSFCTGLASVLALGFALAVAPGPARAGSPASMAAPGAAEVADPAATWVKQLDAAKARLVAARRQVAELEAARSRAITRNYPRGEARARILSDLDKAQKELDSAQQAFPDLLEQARRAGVPAGVLQSYEDDAS